jgi:HK97 family phage prohead protease
MNRRMSREQDGMLIQYAGMAASGGVSDAEQRERCANAPEWWKASLERSREARGMQPLWGRNLSKPAPRSAKPAKPKPPAKAFTLVGTLAPGLSCPVAGAFDGMMLRERIEPTAFDKTLARLANRETFIDLLVGHKGRVIASTVDGTMKLTADPVVGLIVEASIAIAPEHRKLIAETASGKVGLSVSMRCDRASIQKTRDGKRIRVIEQASIEHIAIIAPGNGTPAYRSRVRMVPFGTDGRVARLRAILDALKVICRQDGLIE